MTAEQQKKATERIVSILSTIKTEVTADWQKLGLGAAIKLLQEYAASKQEGSASPDIAWATEIIKKYEAGELPIASTQQNQAWENWLEHQASQPHQEWVSRRIQYLKEQEQIALKEIDKLKAGTIERTAKWDLIRELGYRRNELEQLPTAPQEVEQINKLCISKEILETLNSRNKPFFIDTFRKLVNSFDKEEMSMSKFVEELNIAATKWHFSQGGVQLPTNTPIIREDEPCIIQSAFQFENGKRIIVYTGRLGIRSFECDENWKPHSKPFAECPLEWSGKSATEYHLRLRHWIHKPEDFVPEHSTVLPEK